MNISKTRSVAALVVGLLVAAGPAAAEDVPASIDADTTWSADGSPYRIAADAVVAPGITLTIDSGVAVELGEGVSLSIEGTLLARGTAEEIITIAGIDGARWGSIVFEDSSGDAVYGGIDGYEGGSILEHCHVEGGTAAVQMLAASPLIRSCEFTGNAVDDPEQAVGGAALRILDGSAPRIRDCRFEGNEVGDPGWGGAIYARLSAPVIQDCLFEANRSSYGGAICFDNCHSPIVGNRFLDNEASGEGGAVSLYSSSPAFLDNVVEGNTSMWADGGGVHVCVDCRPHANPIVIENEIRGNQGLYHGAGGIGAAYLRVFRHNTVVNNTTQDEPSDLGWFNELLDEYPEWVTHPDLSNNWWGTTDLDAIEDAVFHGEDDPIYGVAQLEPVAEAPREAASRWAVVTCREIRYDTAGQEMAVYLTIYNPIEADVDVLLALALTYGDRVRIPYSGPVDLPGAAPTPAGHRLSLPARTVAFVELMRPEFDGDPGLGSGTWHVALVNAQTHEPLSEALSARFEIGEGE